MNKHILFVLSFVAVLFLVSCKSNGLALKSPDGSLLIKAHLNSKGSLIYAVQKDGETVIHPSQMGISGDVDFSKGLKVISVSEPQLLTESYWAPAEKRTNRTFSANFAVVELKNKDKKRLKVEFKATDEGVAFRYITKSENAIAIQSEQTSFKFDTTTRAWLHPHADAETGWCETQPSYEEQYHYDMSVGTAAPLVAGWSFPALFKTDKYWVMLSESGLTPDYVGTRLAQESPQGEYFIGFPQKGEMINDEEPNYVVGKEIVSPWRVIVVGSLANVVESQMVSDLAPAADENIDYNWVKPGISTWSWGLMKDESIIYPIQERFINYAADMQWSYCLIDVNWDNNIGYDKIQELVDLGKKRNVGVILWYNSSGAWNSTAYTPKGALVERTARRNEFERISKMGVSGIKVDFWPGDGQSSIQYYYDLMEDAADYKLLVNFHGTTVPRGWSRTFPHLMTMESIRGYEFITFEQPDADMAPKHITMSILARNVVGPMDFTPLCLGEMPGKTRRTGNGFELATTVLMQSGIQHFVEVPEVMAKQPDYVKNFLGNLPAAWDDVKLIDGFPGEYVVMARRKADKWYIAGLSAKSEPIKIKIDISAFATTGNSGNMSIITDGNNNRSLVELSVPVSDNQFEIELHPNGGFVTVL